jgi:hypothetical protein
MIEYWADLWTAGGFLNRLWAGILAYFAIGAAILFPVALVSDISRALSNWRYPVKWPDMPPVEEEDL